MEVTHWAETTLAWRAIAHHVFPSFFQIFVNRRRTVFPAKRASPIGWTVSAPMMMAKLPSMRMNSIFRSNEE
jgi:hypothetical protein